MKKNILLIALSTLILGCAPTKLKLKKNTDVAIDLVNIVDDKVTVTMLPASITSANAVFYMPEIIPGTYSDDDYGMYLENFKAFDSKGNSLPFTRKDSNTFTFTDATKVAKITYQVNDTFDIEGEHDIFSPSGTNFIANKQFLLNLHGLIGYFSNQKEIGYRLAVNRPSNMAVTTTLDKTTQATTTIPFKNMQTVDHYFASRYFEIVDNPIMINAANQEIFNVGDIQITLSVYSPNNKVKASDLRPNIERMMQAQKTYLGAMNTTKKYAIMVYLSTLEPNDAGGFGALEHHTSTVVVLPETMPLEALDNAMLDVVSHEFFHIVTPLNVHSKEIHDFSYNTPKMSKHLWMYEGITEYFAQHFQVQQGLKNKGEFYEVITDKINTANAFQKDMSFTKMSQNILEEPYKSEYINVYSKGALIGMCIDILMREASNGEQGVLQLMKALSQKYGTDKPFNDDTIITEIGQMTYPSVQNFLEKHVVQGTPIDYGAMLKKVGLELGEIRIPVGYLLHKQEPFIDANPATNEIFIRQGVTTSFFKDLGIEGGDIIKSINGKAYTLENVYELIGASQAWKKGDDISFTVLREGKELVLEGKLTQPMKNKLSITELQYFTDSKELRLRKQWLQNN